MFVRLQDYALARVVEDHPEATQDVAADVASLAGSDNLPMRKEGDRVRDSEPPQLQCCHAPDNKWYFPSYASRATLHRFSRRCQNVLRKNITPHDLARRVISPPF